MYKRLVKPFFDKLVALVILVALSPLFIVVLIFLTVANRGTPIFIQARPGMNCQIFRLIKFKTMTDATDEKGQLLPDERRLTAIGKFVRKTSLDELPQLINVLKGDMSLVGPRPLLVEYLQHYDMKQLSRHAVKPGITGWAQVNGRNAISWKQRFDYDVWYVAHQSFTLDFKILLLTFVKVLKAEGINSDRSATMEKFNGN